MVILVVNHVHLDSWLEHATATVVSAAEVLVSVSGVVVGMVFGRRWLVDGPRATTVALLRRAGKLYVASVVVVALVGAMTLVSVLGTEVVTASPRAPERDLYAFDGAASTALAIVTLAAGPWQFNILGFFIAALAAAPALLWLLARGRCWAALLVASWGLYAVGRAWPVDVLPAQSEGPFPLLIWQVPFVHGMVLGWHRRRVTDLMRASRGVVRAVVVAAALAAVYLQLRELGLDPLGLTGRLADDAAAWDRWRMEHFDKSSLDPVRLAAMTALTAAAYLGLRRWEPFAQRAVGWLLLPLGRASFYVFIVHVFLCVAVATVPPLAVAGIGPLGNTLVQVACVWLLWLMASRQVLFRWVPR